MQEGNGETNRAIRVLLADDHTLFRQGLAGLLASYGGLEIIAEVPNDDAARSPGVHPGFDRRDRSATSGRRDTA